jgi:hypothetical protein
MGRTQIRVERPYGRADGLTDGQYGDYMLPEFFGQHKIRQFVKDIQEKVFI